MQHFYQQKYHFYKPLADAEFSGLGRNKKNELSFQLKRQLILHKTSRRFYHKEFSECFFAFSACGYKIYSKQYQRYTQPLTDVQCHAYFFRHLRILDEFQSQTGTKEYQKRHPGDKPYAFLESELMIC